MTNKQTDELRVLLYDWTDSDDVVKELEALLTPFIAAALSEQRQQIVAALPTKTITDPKNQDPINASTHYWQARGFDKCLDQVTQIINNQAPQYTSK